MFGIFKKENEPKLKIAVIMRAIPGSGKSTFAKKIKTSTEASGLTCSIHSSDEKFMVNGEYKFDQSLLGAHHLANHREFCKAMSDGINVVIGDNTNIKRKDYMTYVESAKAAGYRVVSISFVPGDVQMHFQRNVHSVPMDVIQRMKDSFNPVTDSVDDRYTMESHDGMLDSEYAKCVIQAILS